MKKKSYNSRSNLTLPFYNLWSNLDLNNMANKINGILQWDWSTRISIFYIMNYLIYIKYDDAHIRLEPIHHIS